MSSEPKQSESSEVDFTISIEYLGKRQRLHKGSSLTDMPRDYCCIDIETTGYMLGYDAIIEFCGVKVREGSMVEIYSTLIKPPSPISQLVTERTGITNEMLENQPSIEDMANEIYDFLTDEILLGHNVHFDINFLYDTFGSILGKPLSNNFVDLLRFSRRLFKNLENHRLRTVAEGLGITPETWHRAEADCRTTIECYEKCRQYVHENSIDIATLLGRRKRKRKSNVRLRAASIVSETSDFDLDHPLYGKVCVFTGTLEKMVRREAMQYVVNLGGECRDSVSRDVDFLIVGNYDYCSTIKDGKSNKQKQAERLIMKGYDLQIIPEEVFCDLLAIQ
ncbi:MAG: exonuclease [Firmicutes bacterium]|nr:exonuclease [Bacillota bacterium]